MVSGYATATFANRHLSQLDEFSLNLIVGMPGNRGDHHGWLTLAKRFGQRLTVHYLESSPYVHCKAYGWFQQDRSHSGYTGSANYTQSGFLNGGQVNQMVSDDPCKIKDLYDSLIPRAVDIHDYEEKRAEELLDIPGYSFEGSTLPGGVQWLAPGHAVKVSFLSRNGELPARSGLNWKRPGWDAIQIRLTCLCVRMFEMKVFCLNALIHLLLSPMTIKRWTVWWHKMDVRRFNLQMTTAFWGAT